ncbi:YqzE family protein [Paenibacillus soyae]|uniref:YqzE family protein n=1 Tax=Paenibacillus soyae TaxID=2969249 RepID=A0A9X2SAL7_9BACL|nr:YqzE family protein [Paenibacillus soyae]MCR2803767.1 YqzE family protein [Paenibacillus soyae]
MAVKGGSDLVKYMTERFVEYVETPAETRKQARTSAKAAREPWLIRWFGWGPAGLLIWWRGKGRSEERHR